MVNRKRNYVEFIYCECGCGFTRKKYLNRKFIFGHQNRGKNNSMFGKKHSIYAKIKMSNLKIGKKGKNSGEKHYNWKGNKVGYASLHEWVRKYFPQPYECQQCNRILPLDLANITGIYNRDFNNWKYLCRKCHNDLDRIYERNFKPFILKHSKQLIN